MDTLIREPLLYFVIGGALLFMLAGDNTSSGSPGRQINVNKADLLEFIRNRTQSFAPGKAEARLEQASPREVDSLIKEYIREEALYQEALLLGFENSDYVIKRRLGQKVEMAAEGFADTSTSITQADLEAYFANHQARYQISQKLTFSHIFWATTNPESKDPLLTAEQLKQQLNSSTGNQINPQQQGQRFAYHQNYADRSPEFLSGHFGTEFVNEISRLKPNTVEWQGPLKSKFGYHLVLLTNNSPAQTPELNDIVGQVSLDLKQHLTRDVAEQSIATLIEKYTISIDPEIQVLVSELKAN